MPKMNIPEDMETLETLAGVRIDAVYERLDMLLPDAEIAEGRYTQAKEAGVDVEPEVRKLGLQAPHLRALIEKIKGDASGNATKVAQLVAAADLTTENEKLANEMRLQRDRMLQVIHVRYGVAKAKLCQGYDIRRSKLNKSFNSFNGLVPDLSQEQAKATADEYHARYCKAISVEATARAFRDDLLAELERPSRGPNGQIGAGYTPAELARVSGMTESRITQIRTGSTNASRTRKAREERKAKQADARADLEKIGA